MNLLPVQYLYRRLQVNNPLRQTMTLLHYNYRKPHFLVRVQLSVEIVMVKFTKVAIVMDYPSYTLIQRMQC